MKMLAIGQSEEMVKNIPFWLGLRWPNATVLSAVDASQGIELLETETPDIVIADFSLPGLDDGLALVSRVRDFSDVPLIVLTQGTETDRAKVLEAGADDCIAAPFDAVELLAKVRALLRRAYALGFQRDGSTCASGDLVIDLSSREAFVSGNPVRLTPHEYELLVHLVRNEGRVLTHRTLLDKVWGSECADDLSFLKKYVYRLRRKLNEDGKHPKLIVSERGIGYRFVRHP